MVSKCCVPFCNRDTRTQKVSLHNFTRVEKLKNAWITNIQRGTGKSEPKPFKLFKYTKICSAHFKKKDFVIGSERNRLKLDAVPSIFAWTTNTKMVLKAKQEYELEYEAGASNMKQSCKSLDARPNNHPAEKNIIEDENAISKVVEESTDMLENPRTADCEIKINETETTTEPQHNNTPSLQQDQEGRLQMNSIQNLDGHYRTLYCDLLIEFQNFKSKCKCNVRKCHKAVNVCTIMNEALKSNIVSKTSFFSIESMKNDDSAILYYTGFINFKVLMISFNLLFEYQNGSVQINYGGKKGKSSQHLLTQIDEYFLVLIKLRQNFGYEHLSKLFNVSVSTVGTLVISWINFLYVRLGSLNLWPHRDILLAHAPKELKLKYPNVIGSLDATELYMQTPSSLLRQSQTYSHYKHTNTLKALIVIDGNGAVIFASALFTGSISDNQLLEKSGFAAVVHSKLQNGDLLPGDIFLADKGFTSTEILQPIKINIPVFRINNKQFSVDEVHKTQTIARERVHVERAIGRVKSYKIVKSEVPISLLGCFNQIWTICCLLSNFRMPLRSQSIN